MTIDIILSQKGTHIGTIDLEASVKTAADRLCARINGALAVTSRGKAVLGLISEREIVHAFSQYGQTAASMPVKEIMRCPVLTTSPEEGVDRAIQLMTRNRMRHMPVLRHGELAGIIRIDDLFKHRLEALERETRVLRDAYFEEVNRRGRRGVPWSAGNWSRLGLIQTMWGMATHSPSATTELLLDKDARRPARILKFFWRANRVKTPLFLRAATQRLVLALCRPIGANNTPKLRFRARPGLPADRP